MHQQTLPKRILVGALALAAAATTAVCGITQRPDTGPA
jgi:hypothetical protein